MNFATRISGTSNKGIFAATLTASCENIRFAIIFPQISTQMCQQLGPFVLDVPISVAYIYERIQELP